MLISLKNCLHSFKLGIGEKGEGGGITGLTIEDCIAGVEMYHSVT